MSETILPEPEVIDQPAYFPRISRYDGRAIEEALAGASLFEPGIQIEGAIVEATYAVTEPALLKRLQEDDVPFLIDLQTLRFATPTYLDVEPLASLAYAPPRPFGTGDAGGPQVAALATSSLLFQQKVGARHYLAPALPAYDHDLHLWLELNQELLHATSLANGSADIDRRPLFAQVAPGRRALAEPERFLGWLLDVPIAGVYVQPLRLDPVDDGLEKLATYSRFLRALKDAGLTVIAGRLGAFGLLMQALVGLDAFDSGLGEAERHDLTQLVRPRPRREDGKRQSGGGRDRRIYLELLKTTLPSKVVEPILNESGLRARFTCTHGCCYLRGFDALKERRRNHYLWVRHDEVNELRRRPTREMKLEHVHNGLLEAREQSRVVRKALAAKAVAPPSFGHLERWLGLLAREASIPEAA